jgi:hypothetical protein
MLTVEQVEKAKEEFPVGSVVQFKYVPSSKPGIRKVKVEENDGVSILGRDESRNGSYRRFMIEGIVKV